MRMLAVWQGGDDTPMLLESLDDSQAGFCNLKQSGEIVTPSGMRIPCSPKASGDLQFVKAGMNCSPCKHSPWCTCAEGNRMLLPTEEESSRMVDWKTVKPWLDKHCHMKTQKEMCIWSHYSPEVAQGLPFAPFKCDCGYKADSEEVWLKQVEGWKVYQQEAPVEAKAALLDHARRHHRHMLCSKPVLPLDSKDWVPDVLHLLYLNNGKLVWKYGVERRTGDTCRELVNSCLTSNGFCVKVN